MLYIRNMKTIYSCFTMLFFICKITAQTWTPVVGITGTVYCAETDNTALFVGTDAGIFKSTDNGKSFTVFSKNFPSGKIVGLSKTGNNYLAYIAEEGLYLSTDEGNTWTKKMGAFKLFSDNFDNGSYTIAKTTNGVFVFDSRTDSMYCSADNGVTWIPKFIYRSALNTYPAGDRLFYYNTKNGLNKLYYSTDLGNSWIECNTGLTYQPASIVFFKNKYFALTNHIYELNSDNVSWKKISTDSLKFTNSFGTNTFWPGFVAVTDNAIVAQTGGNAGLHMAKWALGDGGWKDNNTGLFHSTKFGQNLDAIFGFKEACLLSRDDSLYISENLGRWNYINPVGLNSQKLYDFTVEGKNLYSLPWVVTSKTTSFPYFGKIHSTDIDLRRWTPTTMPNINLEGKGMWDYYLEKINDTFFSLTCGAITQIRFLNKTINQWNNITSLEFTNDFPLRRFKYRDTIFNFGGANKVLGSVAAVLTSKATYSNFKDISTNLYLGSTGGTAQGMQSLTEHNGKLLGLVSVAFGGKSTIFEYQNSGKSDNYWNKKVEFINGASFAAYSLISWDGRLFLGLANEKGVLVSNDNGNSWTAFNNGLQNCTPVYFYALGDTLIMGAKTGIYLLEKGNTGWKSISDNLPACNPIKMSHDGKFIYMHQKNGSLWIMPRSGQKLSVEKNVKKFKDVSVFPNPAESQLTIYGLEVKQNATFEILDLNGKTIQSGKLKTNKVIDIHSLNTGSYILRINCENKFQSCRFIKIK